MNEVTARSTDPETSHEAAERFDAGKSKQRSVQTVVRILEVSGSLTDFEIGARWHLFWPTAKWSESLPRKARHWAREAGLVKHAGFGAHRGHRVRKWCLGKEENLPAKRTAKTAAVSEAEAGLLQRCKQLEQELAVKTTAIEKIGDHADTFAIKIVELEKELAQAKQDLATANEEVDAIHACADATEEQLREALALLKGAETANAKLRADIGGFPNLDAMRQCMVEAADNVKELERDCASLTTEVLRLQTLIPSSKARRWFLSINMADSTLVGISLDRATAENIILPMASGRVLEMVEVL